MSHIIWFVIWIIYFLKSEIKSSTALFAISAPTCPTMSLTPGSAPLVGCTVIGSFGEKPVLLLWNKLWVLIGRKWGTVRVWVDVRGIPDSFRMSHIHLFNIILYLNNGANVTQTSLLQVFQLSGQIKPFDWPANENSVSISKPFLVPVIHAFSPILFCSI